MAKKLKKIVCFGGGTGVSVVLAGLRDYPINLSAIVTMFDNGGSSGKLRQELGILPLGDIRQCLAALSNEEELTPILYYRFFKGSLKGHSFGNLLLAAMLETQGDLHKTIKKASNMLGVKANIIPVTTDKSNIVAVLNNKKKVKGEEDIINCNSLSKVGLKRLYLQPKVKASPQAILAVKEADMIIFAPGKLYTSILPNLLVKDMLEAINKSKAKKVFVCNLMTQVGNTDNLNVEDFTRILEDYLGEELDHVIFNKEKFEGAKLRKIKKVFPEGKFIKYSKSLLSNGKFIGVDLLDKNIKKLNPADILVKGANKRTMVLHDSKKLAKVIFNLCK